MKNRILLACFVAFCLGLLSGCAWMDLDGNGRFDPIAYANTMDVSIQLVDANGAPYQVQLDELGKRIVGQYIQVKTGLVVKQVETGGFIITDPDTGVSIRVAPKG